MNYYGSLVEGNGSGSGGGDTVDVPIKTIKVNGVAQLPVNKAVDITVPTKTSDLTDDTHVEITKANYEALSDDEKSNGTLYFCTDTGELFKNGVPYGGSSSPSVEVPIEVVKVNGIALTPDADKAVDIAVPVQKTVTQAEYDALVQAGTVKAGVEYFCSDTGVVYKDNVKYGALSGGESADNLVTLTQQEYNELEEAGATLTDVAYFCTDTLRIYINEECYADRRFKVISQAEYDDLYDNSEDVDDFVYYCSDTQRIYLNGVVYGENTSVSNVAITFAEAGIDIDGIDTIPTSSLAGVEKVSFLNFGGSNPKFASLPDGANEDGKGSLVVIPRLDVDGSIITDAPLTLMWIDANNQDGIFGVYDTVADTVTWLSNELDISGVVDTEITNTSDDTKLPTSKAVREYVRNNAGGSSNTVVVTQQEYDDMVGVDECLPDTAYFCSDTGRIYMNGYCCTIPRFTPKTQAEYDEMVDDVGYAEGIVYYCSDTKRIYLNGVAYGGSDISSVIDTEITETSDDTKVPSSKAVKTYVDNQTVVVDENLSAVSENAVQNKVVKAYLDEMGYLYSPSGFKFKVQVADDGTLSAVSVAQANLFTFDTSKASSKTVKLQSNSGGVDNHDGITNWGDGTVDSSLEHTYTADGVYTIETKYLINDGSTGDSDTRKMLVGCSAVNSDMTDFSYLFYNCTNLTTLDASNWDTTKVINMKAMFSGCTSLATLNISGWSTSNVTDTSSMFSNCIVLTSLDVSEFDVSNVQMMNSMFFKSGVVTLDLSTWNTKNVTNMNSMFKQCTSLTSIENNFDTSNVTVLGSMFMGCTALSSLDVSGWDTSNVTDLSNTFNSCSALAELDVSGWNTSKVTSMDSTFQKAGIKNLDLSSWDVSKVTTMMYMFTYGTFETINISNWLAEVCSNIMYLFGACSNLHTLYADNVSFLKAQNMMSLFYGDAALTSLDLSTWKAPVLGGLPNTFALCTGLTSIKLSGMDTSKITALNNTFQQCSALTNLDISGCDFSKVTNTAGAFNKTTALTLDGINMTDCSEDTVNVITNAFNARTA